MSKKQKISAEEGQRWFIWTLVIILVSLGGLATYVYNISASDFADVPVTINPSLQIHRPLSTEQIVGTTWVPEAKGGKTLITFLKTKNNDPQHQAYDYRIAMGTLVEEVGYWTDVGGQIQPIVTRVPGTPQNIQRMYATESNMFVYSPTSSEPLKFVQFGATTSKTTK